MSTARPEPERSRRRELISVIVGGLLALGVGRTITMHTQPPAVLAILIFLVLYVVVYLLVWRLLGRMNVR